MLVFIPQLVFTSLGWGCDVYIPDDGVQTRVTFSSTKNFIQKQIGRKISDMILLSTVVWTGSSGKKANKQTNKKKLYKPPWLKLDIRHGRKCFIFWYPKTTKQHSSRADTPLLVVGQQVCPCCGTGENAQIYHYTHFHPPEGFRLSCIPRKDQKATVVIPDMS